MKAITPIFFLMAIILGVASMSLYTVYQTDQAIVLRLGEIVTDSEGKPKISNPGLHFKIPFIDEIVKFDIRLHMLEIKPKPPITKEKKTVEVDLFVQWKIDDLALFYKRNRGRIFEAEAVLEKIVSDRLNVEFGVRTIQEVVSGERIELMKLITEVADENARDLGVKVFDVRIEKIEFPTDVKVAVYNRMKSERERIASEIIAEGKAAAIEIRADADRKKVVLLAAARKKYETIRGGGDAEAVKIYAEAYNKAPEFYKFYRSLEAYKKIFASKNDVLVLKSNSEFFKYLQNNGG